MLRIALSKLLISGHVTLIRVVSSMVFILFTLAHRLILVASSPEFKVVLVRVVCVGITVLVAGHLKMARQRQMLMMRQWLMLLVLLLHGKGILSFLRVHR